MLGVLTTAACLTVPFSGFAVAQPTSVPAPVAPSTTLDTTAEMRGTASLLWADELVARASRPYTPQFKDLLSRAEAARVVAVDAAGIPLTNLNLPLVAGTPLGDPALLITSPYVSPVPGPITSPFGPRFHPILHYVRSHNGVDMTAACGTPIVAMADGTVTRSAAAGGYGLLVEIDHGTVDEDRMSTRYAHLSVLGVNVGQKVSKGQQIGLAGTTGLSTGCHLHFEVLINGSFVDPRAVLSGAPFVRLDTPMVPWTPGTRPTGPLPKVPATETGPLPDLKEVPLVPAPGNKPSPEGTPSPSPTPDPNPGTPTRPIPNPEPQPTTPLQTPEAPEAPVPVPVVTPEPTPEPTHAPTPEPTPAPTPEPKPEPTPDAPVVVTPQPTTPAPTTPAAPASPAPTTEAIQAPRTAAPAPTAAPSAAPAAAPAPAPSPVPTAAASSAPTSESTDA